MDPVRAMPDSKALVINALIAALPGVTVKGKTGDPEEFEDTLPLVVVTRVGGTMYRRKCLDNPWLDIDVYSLSDTQTFDTMIAVQSHIEALRNTSHPEGVVTATNELSGPAERPETNPAISRMGMTASLIVRPN